MLMKLISIGALVFVLGKFTKVGQEQMKYIFNATASGTTQSEVNAISQQVYVENCIGGQRIPQQSDEDWSYYIQSNMTSDAKGRRTSEDLWLTPYRVREVESQVSGDITGFEVRSAGPDTTFRTVDDIASVRQYPE